jgi:DNA polymerase-1
MLKFSNGGILIESVSELPALPDNVSELFLDFETTSGDPRLDSLNPWHHCAPYCYAFTWDQVPLAWCVPAGLADNWLQELVRRSKTWVNHNVKYDAHVFNNGIGPLPEDLELRCTVVSAKILDSDRMFSGGYGLDALCMHWLKEDISSYEERLKPYLHKNKDFGRIPLDIIAEYNCQDALSNRRLHRYIDARTPEQCQGVLKTEIELTRVLFETEVYGMCVKPVELISKEFIIMTQMCELEERLEKAAGRSFRPHVNEDCFEVLCLQYGLPVAGYTDEGNPSFDKEALAAYIGHPHAPQDIVTNIIAYRKLNTLKNFFITPYQELNIDGILHPQYNQVVRTGRMSCKTPNSQQLNKEAKELIHPREGNSFISIDFSQIEFRYMMHYIQDHDAIAAYNENPDTDFHQWVADMCEISRKPAKTVNFAIGFGAGKKKTIKMLTANGEVIGAVDAEVRALIARGTFKESEYKNVFNSMCEDRAIAVFNKYHETLPGIKRTSRKCAAVAEQRGYVYNIYGRHRHLPRTHAHIAFNSINQSSAADLMKERTVAAWHMIKDTPIRIVASVHDETLFEAPTEIAENPDVIRDLVNLMEHPAIEIRVPVRCSVGASKLHWREACSDQVAKPLKYDPAASGRLEGLKKC